MTNPDTAPPSPPRTVADRADQARSRAIKGLVAAFLATLVAIVAVQWITDADDTPEAGDPFPAGILTTVDGEEFDLLTIGDGGAPTVVNFFATWCSVCIAEMPAFEAVHQANKADVMFIGINTQESNVDEALRLVETTGVTYQILLGDDGSLVTDVGGLAMPTTAFVDADGNLVGVHSGVLSADDLQNKIDEVFG